MSQVTPSQFRFQDLPAQIADNILSQLSDTDLAALHVANTSTFGLCYEYLRHGREASRRQREKDFQERYAGKVNDLPLIERHGQSRAYLDLVRRDHMRKYPRFYALSIQIERLTTPEISLLIQTYTNVFTYLFSRTSSMWCLRNGFWCYPAEDHLLLPYNLLKSFYYKKIDYRLVFQFFLNLQSKSPFWSGSLEDLANIRKLEEDLLDKTKYSRFNFWKLKIHSSESDIKSKTNYN